MKNSLLILLIAASLLLGGMVFGQEQTGDVIGSIVLEDGSAVPGVAVEAEGTGLVGKRSTISNEQGAFRFMGLPPGTYSFTFTLDGFKTKKRSDIRVDLGRTYKLDIVMETGVMQNEITVTGKSPVIDVRKSASTVNISKEEFKKLPKGRGFMTIVTKTPGINFEREFQTDTENNNQDYSAGVAFDGASPSENTFYVDGVDTTTLFEGKSGNNVNFDFIEEVQVKSSGYAAEYGGSMGGVISVVTRSGGNEFHGNVVAYYDSDILGNNPTKTLRTVPTNDDIAEYVTYPEDKWSRIEPGFGLGGYIIKDKLWFFGSFIPKFWSRTRDAKDYIGKKSEGGEDLLLFIDDPEYSGSFKRKDTFYAGSLKLTAQLAANLRMSISGTLDNSDWKGELPNQDGSGNPEKNWPIYGYKYPSLTFGGSLDYTLGNNLMVNANLGFFKHDKKQLVAPAEPRWRFMRTNVGIPGFTGETHAAGWQNYSLDDGYQTISNMEDKWTGSVGITYYANFGGEHVFKTGMQMQRIGLDKNDAYPFDAYYFYWGDPYESPNTGTNETTFGYVEARDPFGAISKLHSWRWAIYLQDSWTIGEKLTLNLGVRMEKEEIPSFRDDLEPFVFFDFFDKFAPRVGFAYDVFGDSNLKFFGSYGVYYDVMKLPFAESCFGGEKWMANYYDVVAQDWRFPDYEHPLPGGLNGGRYFESLDKRTVDLSIVDPNMKPYQKNEITFGMQKALGEDWSIGGRFLYNWVVNAIEDIGIQTPHGEEYFRGNPGSDYIQGLFDEAAAEGLVPVGTKATKAVRRYTSVTINLDRKFKNNWMGGIAYTWSRLYGNFSGLTSADEHGRKDPGVQRYFDAWFLTYNQFGEDTLGLLPTDRTHQFKAYGAYTFDFGLTLGFNAYAMTGTPVTTEIELNGMQGFYPLGRGNMGRNDLLWQLDLYAEYNLKISEKYSLNFSVNVTNVTDNQIAQRTWQCYNTDAPIYLEEQQIKEGFDYLKEITDREAYIDPQYMMKYSYLDHIAARIGVKFLF